MGIASIIEQAEMGRFSRLVVKNATVDMNDALYGVFRTFTAIQLDIAPTPNGKAVEGSFAADFGGTVMKGILERVIDDEGRGAPQGVAHQFRSRLVRAATSTIPTL